MEIKLTKFVAQKPIVLNKIKIGTNGTIADDLKPILRHGNE